MKRSLPVESERQKTHYPAAVADISSVSQAFADNRESTTNQRHLMATMANSPQAIVQRQVSRQIHNNPRMLAQRRTLYGESTQRIEEKEPLQKKSALLQRVAEEESLQKKVAVESSARLEQQSSQISGGNGQNAVTQRKVKILNYTADNPRTVLSVLKDDAKIPKSYTGVSSKVNHGYERPKTIAADVDADKVNVDDRGVIPNDMTTTNEVGGLGYAESMVFGYDNDHDYHGGHLMGDRFWQASANSLLEGNLVPMLQVLNSSLYKIFEHEVVAYLATNPLSKLKVEIKLSYGGDKTIQLDAANSKTSKMLTDNYADVNDFDLTQSVTVSPRVPFQIEVILYTYNNSPDLAEKTYQNPPGDILKSRSYDSKGYYQHVSWDATKSEKAANYKKIGNYVRFKPVTLKLAGVRTYNFYQERN